jgi:type IV secretory pathway VirD2 relaxase
VIVVKHRYIAGRGRGSGGKVVALGKALAHVKYIQHRPGPDREQGGREMFNERDQVDAREMREAIKELDGSRVVVHKLTLAPEINPADKKAFTREVMDNLGRDMGRDLNWFAVQHNNTDHHHIHVVVLGKDRNGTDVRIDLKHIDKVKEYGDRYLERCHPLELERSRREREDREKARRAERVKEREAARDERIRDGLELPWLHQKLVREQLEPYKDWKEKREAREKEPEKKRDELERPYHQDTIEAAGKEWSKANNLKELRDLNEYLWDNYEERIPKDEYKKLVSWIKEKERLGEQQPEKKESGKEKGRRDEFEYQGEKYSKKDDYEKLTGLANRLRDSDERLPFNDYQKLRGWMENKDRERFSGALEAELQRTHKKFERSKTMADLKAAEGGRVIDPLQEHFMRNPIVGLFMTEAAIASEIVRSIPLDDRNRDYVKERIDGLEDAKKNLDEREKARRDKALEKLRMPWEIKSQEDRDREAREKIEKAKEEAERKRAEEKKKERERKREKDRSPFERDEWGRW